MNAKQRTVSGMRPTGPLHIGHYFGAIKNYLELQESSDAYFFIADWHALTSDYADTARLREYSQEMLVEWLSAGLDPEKCVIFKQSSVKEHAELHLLLSMITPLGWLERCPTYKEQQQEITNKDLGTYGFLGYPVLMCSDIILYRPHWVPVGQDQLPHLEITREIARRFNYLYSCDVFIEPQAKLTPAAKCPGLDGRKMSKSYGNGIFLKDSLEEIAPKIKSMFTDSARVKRTDPGNPDVCNLFPYHVLLASPEKQAEVRESCVNASLGCVDCKKIFLENLTQFLEPMQANRQKYIGKTDLLEDILKQGQVKAQKAASETMNLVYKAMHL